MTANNKHAPEAYELIWRWGRLLSSQPSWIREQQERAAREGAPLNAIYRKEMRWHTADEVLHPDTRALLGLEPLTREKEA